MGAMSKLEEAARAAYCRDWGARSGPWEKAAIATRDFWIENQRAAIAALREPTEAQVRAVALDRCDKVWCQAKRWCFDPDCLAAARRTIAAYWDALEKEDGDAV